MQVISCWVRSLKNQMIAFHFRDLKATVMPHPVPVSLLAKCLCPFICSLCDIIYMHVLDGPISSVCLLYNTDLHIIFQIWLDIVGELLPLF